MQLFIYILVYPIIIVFSHLPFRLLYLISDFLFWIIYYVVGYRKNIAAENIRLTFPEKNEKERDKILKDFYRHFSDLFMEMMKSYGVSLQNLQKRYYFKDIDMINKLTEKGKNIVIVGGHYANWEWVFSLAAISTAFPIATYLKINNKYFEKLMLRNRSRFGGALVETKKLRKVIDDFEKHKRPYILGLLADQSPQLHRAKYWRNFFGHEVPVFVGAESLAKQHNTAFVFMQIQKKQRGIYEVRFELITETPHEYPDYQLTDLFIDKLENQIREKPEYYLWTHRRFKHMNKKPKP